MLLSPLISKIVRMIKDTGLGQLRPSIAPDQIRSEQDVCLPLLLSRDRCR